MLDPNNAPGQDEEKYNDLLLFTAALAICAKRRIDELSSKDETQKPNNEITNKENNHGKEEN